LLALVLAHEKLLRLWNEDSPVASAVTANPCTRNCVRIPQFGTDKAEEVLNKSQDAI
jgi:hypothetical protein